MKIKGVGRNVKLTAATVSIVVTVGILLLLYDFDEEVAPQPKRLEISSVLGPDERLITVEVVDASKFVLDFINEAVWVDILTINNEREQVVVAQGAKLVEIIEGDSSYVIAVVLKRRVASRVLEYEHGRKYSIMVSSKKGFSAGDIEIVENRIGIN